MKRLRRRNLMVCALLVLLLVTGLVVLPVVRQLRQEAKNRALIEAVKQNDERAVTRLLNEGADANAKDLPAETRPFWRVMWDQIMRRKANSSTAPTALILAVRPSNLYSPDGKSKDIVGLPENPALIRALLQHQADPNIPDDYDCSPLVYAVLMHNNETALSLISYGAKTESNIGRNRYKLLVLAAWNPFTDLRVLKAMLDHGGNIDGQDENGATPLMMLTQEGKIEGVRLFLSRHPNVAIKNKQGYTALEIARGVLKNPLYRDLPAYKQIVRMLQQAGAH